MKTLALRIYLAVVTVLLIFALVTGWLAQRHMDQERTQFQSQAIWRERAIAWAELLENSLPSVDQPEELQAQVFLEWADRLRLPMALDSADGRRLATSHELEQRLAGGRDSLANLTQIQLSDGRVLWVLRPAFMRSHPRFSLIPPPEGHRRDVGDGPPLPPGESLLGPLAWLLPPWIARGAPALIMSLVLLFIAVAAGAWPVANRLTRRLQALRSGVEAFGSGQLQHRVAVEGRDEVASLAKSFNDAAQRIEDLVTSNRNLLANASHELRSPLARMKMAVSLMGDMPPARAAQLKEEIHQDISELDALVEEVLLASRLDAKTEMSVLPVDLLGMATEEASRVGAEVSTFPDATAVQPYPGDERLLRRAMRNLLENAKRYGGPHPGIVLTLTEQQGSVSISVSDRGPGVPVDQRERIFEPFYRMPGHAEHAGGVGLGLSLVRQIALRHNGSVKCDSPPEGGGRFTITLPR